MMLADIFAQRVGIGTNSPDSSALLELKSTNSGFLPPRMTFAQRNAIVSPAAGLMIYCTDCDSSGQPQFYNGARWCNMLGAAANGPIVQIANLPSVTIGTQIWSSKNLDVARYRNGDPIPQVTDPNQWSNLTTGAWCWYNNDSAAYAATYGRLYNWYAVNDPRGLAPQGWHVPTEGDWNRLVKFIDTNADTTACQNCILSFTAGGAMKSINGWNIPNIGATNSSGFSSLPGGFRYLGNFYSVGFAGIWWSAELLPASNVWGRLLDDDAANVYRYYGNKSQGFSVRVVRD